VAFECIAFRGSERCMSLNLTPQASDAIAAPHRCFLCKEEPQQGIVIDLEDERIFAACRKCVKIAVAKDVVRYDALLNLRVAS
jgi:hypothetical protein